ncbi:MAG: hypothetical protein MOB07_23300 [Acidobacteria bacterium]|nr:hypothetical protein [Acidobacteriota bacterium]
MIQEELNGLTLEECQAKLDAITYQRDLLGMAVTVLTKHIELLRADADFQKKGGLNPERLEALWQTLRTPVSVPAEPKTE